MRAMVTAPEAGSCAAGGGRMDDVARLLRIGRARRGGGAASTLERVLLQHKTASSHRLRTAEARPSQNAM